MCHLCFPATGICSSSTTALASKPARPRLLPNSPHPPCCAPAMSRGWGSTSPIGTASFLTTYYPENYFSYIIIDECHRSAWGKWSQVLTRNPDAVQIGLTATPRQLEVSERSREADADRQVNADNLRHFG